jgi:hypothetical protein
MFLSSNLKKNNMRPDHIKMRLLEMYFHLNISTNLLVFFEKLNHIRTFANLSPLRS